MTSRVPELVWRAWTEPELITQWFTPRPWTTPVAEVDLRPGGRFRTVMRSPEGEENDNTGCFLEIVPNERLVYTDSFDDPNLPGEMLTTVILKSVSCGTDLSVTQEGIPEAIPVEMCYLGWQESLMQLATLVEPEIPD